jgi:hypothetical protein
VTFPEVARLQIGRRGRRIGVGILQELKLRAQLLLCHEVKDDVSAGE